MPSNRPAGMTAFAVVWLGQVVSLFGTSMTRFALIIWAWQLTGSATALALVGFFSFAPEVLLSPVAGALVDRWNRKLVMMLSDLAAGLATVAILLLLLFGRLEIWHLYAAGAFAGAFGAFQWPAYSAAISTMLPKAQYVRANSMMALADSASGVFAPVLAALLLTVISIQGILLIDVATFVVAVGALLLVVIPQPARSEAGRLGRGNLWKESGYGFRYILERPSLLGLQLVFFGGNLMATFGFTLVAPMVLARTGSNQVVLGGVESAAAIGGVIGASALSAWGGPRRRVHGVLIGHALAGMGQVLMAFGLPFWVVGAFAGAFIIPVINASNQAIWQAKVAPDVQGRVFAARRLIAQISAPVAILAAGPLADRLMEPAMAPGGSLAPAFGWLVGTGPGAGMAVMFLFSGLAVVLVGLAPYAVGAIRNAEDILLDHDAVAVAASTD